MRSVDSAKHRVDRGYFFFAVFFFATLGLAVLALVPVEAAFAPALELFLPKTLDQFSENFVEGPLRIIGPLMGIVSP
ncbi:MAG: hypothetical protein RIS70_1915 [Planctomycetota bacterium]